MLFVDCVTYSHAAQRLRYGMWAAFKVIKFKFTN